MDLYFDCNNGISGDMAVGAMLDLGADRKKLEQALKSINLSDEFDYEIKKMLVNSISATDFNVILKHHHNYTHRNLDDINKIIDGADMSQTARDLAKKIFLIVAKAESKVHQKDIKEIHFHEVGAIDSIVDIVAFSVLFDDIKPDNCYFSTLSDGCGTVICRHGALSVPVPAVCEILSEYKIPLKITDNEGEMITPTGVAIVAALYNNKKLDFAFVIEKSGSGRGKRNYKNLILKVMKIKKEDNLCI